MTTTAQAPEFGASAPAAAADRSVWLDSVAGVAVFAIVLFQVWIWVLEPLPNDYWAPAKDGWTHVNSHFGIGMPLLLLVSGCLVARVIRSGIRAPKVHLRSATHYYLYVVWLCVLTLFSFTLPAGELPHRIGSIGDALSQLVIPDTPLWYVVSLAVFTLVLALVARVPPWLVLSALTVLSVTSGMFETPGMWHRILALMVFFAIGVYCRDELWRLDGRATLPRIIGLAVLGEALTQGYARTDPESLLAGVLEFSRLGIFGLAVLLLMAIVVRSPNLGRLGSFVGRRTLQVYTTHIVVLWILILFLYQSPDILDLLATPVVAVMAPLVLAAFVTAVALAARPTLEHLGYLFTMPRTWETQVLAWRGGRGATEPAAAEAPISETQISEGWANSPGLARESAEAEVVERTETAALQAVAVPSELPGCSVIVVAYNCSALLSERLPEIDWAGADARVVVVDNSDDANERQQTLTLCDWYGWDYLPQDRNGGFGAAANAGADYAIEAGSTSIIFLNPDAWLSAETVSRLARSCAERPDTAFSPIILRPDRQPWFTGGTLDLATGRVSGRIDRRGGTLRWLSGAVLAISSDLWRQVGGFDSDFFLYWEDVDLSWRIRRMGGRLEVLPDAEAFHSVGGTQQVGRKSSPYVYYNTRNRLWFAARHLSREESRPWLLATARLCWELIGMAGRTPASFWAAMRGAWSGWRAVRRARAIEGPADEGPADEGRVGADVTDPQARPLVTTGGN